MGGFSEKDDLKVVFFIKIVKMEVGFIYIVFVVNVLNLFNFWVRINKY